MEQEKPKLPNKPLKKGKNEPKKFSLNWLYFLILVGLFGAAFFDNEKKGKEVDWSVFETYVENGYVERIDYYSNKEVAYGKILKDSLKQVFGKDAELYLKNPVVQTAVLNETVIEKLRTEQLLKNNRNIAFAVHRETDYFNIFLTLFMPVILLVFLFWLLNRRMAGMGGPGGVFNVGKSRAKLFEKGENKNKTTFKDVAGLEGAKEEVEEIVAFLKSPDKYTQLGGK
ncbi:MAG: cell division protein FtsH, partial [Paludibacter sp.]